MFWHLLQRLLVVRSVATQRDSLCTASCAREKYDVTDNGARSGKRLSLHALFLRLQAELKFGTERKCLLLGLCLALTLGWGANAGS